MNKQGGGQASIGLQNKINTFKNKFFDIKYDFFTHT